MKKLFIFLTPDGVTYSSPLQPEPDVDNLQVVGIAEGEDEEEAFENLLKENPWILNTHFDELICIEIKNRISKGKRFYLEALKE